MFPRHHSHILFLLREHAPGDESPFPRVILLMALLQKHLHSWTLQEAHASSAHKGLLVPPLAHDIELTWTLSSNVNTRLTIRTFALPQSFAPTFVVF